MTQRIRELELELERLKTITKFKRRYKSAKSPNERFSEQALVPRSHTMNERQQSRIRIPWRRNHAEERLLEQLEAMQKKKNESMEHLELRLQQRQAAIDSLQQALKAKESTIESLRKELTRLKHHRDNFDGYGSANFSPWKYDHDDERLRRLISEEEQFFKERGFDVHAHQISRAVRLVERSKTLRATNQRKYTMRGSTDQSSRSYSPNRYQNKFTTSLQMSNDRDIFTTHRMNQSTNSILGLRMRATEEGVNPNDADENELQKSQETLLLEELLDSDDDDSIDPFSNSWRRSSIDQQVLKKNSVRLSQSMRDISSRRESDRRIISQGNNNYSTSCILEGERFELHSLYQARSAHERRKANNSRRLGFESPKRPNSLHSRQSNTTQKSQRQINVSSRAPASSSLGRAKLQNAFHLSEGGLRVDDLIIPDQIIPKTRRAKSYDLHLRRFEQRRKTENYKLSRSSSPTLSSSFIEPVGALPGEEDKALLNLVDDDEKYSHAANVDLECAITRALDKNDKSIRDRKTRSERKTRSPPKWENGKSGRSKSPRGGRSRSSRKVRSSSPTPNRKDDEVRSERSKTKRRNSRRLRLASLADEKCDVNQRIYLTSGSRRRGERSKSPIRGGNLVDYTP